MHYRYFAHNNFQRFKLTLNLQYYFDKYNYLETLSKNLN